MLFAIFAATLVAAPAPVGTTGPDAADARCIALMNYMIAKGTPEQQNAARAGTIYFIGKLRGRNPSVNVAVVLKSAADAASQAKMNAQAEIKRCGDEVTAAANALRPPSAATPRKP